MGINIQVTDVTFTKKIGLLVPYSSNLVGCWRFNDTLNNSIKNLVTGVAGTLVGAPTILNNRLLADKANGFITDVSVSGEKTFISIAKSSASSILLGSINYDAGVSGNDGIAYYTSKPMVQLDGASKPQSATVVDLNNVHFVAGALGASSNSLYVSKGGILTEGTAMHTGNLSDINLLRIGGWGVNSTSLVGNTETCAALVYNRKLTSAEINEVFNYFKQIFTID